MKANPLGMTAAILVIVIWFAAIIGWVCNLFAVIGMAMDGVPVGSEFVVRIIGIFVAPVGALMGWF